MIGADDEPGFRELTGKIARDRAFETASYKDTVLRRRIAVRMRARSAANYAAYSNLLDADPLEYERLLDALTINVTKLYRNAETWDVLAAQVLPVLWATRAPRLQCWVAGCASGEEAYTLAALWHQFVSAATTASSRATAGIEPVSRVRIVASDIDRRSLAAAKRGAYASPAFQEIPDALRRRYFASEPDGLASAAPELRALIEFERRDLLLDAPPAGPTHLITCRNVIIYFDRDSQEKLMQRFHDALVPGGFLVLGKVETLLGPSRALFEPMDQRQRIFRRP